MTRKQRRLTLILAAGAVLGLALALILTSLKDQIVFFRSPAEVKELGMKPGTRFRLGGLVESASLVKTEGQRVSFRVTDGKQSMAVSHVGILPDLFREGQGVVCEGTLQADGSFVADTVLAKHDETYMPRDVADALKKQGVWQGVEKGLAPK